VTSKERSRRGLAEERRKRAALLPPNAECEVCGTTDPMVLNASDVTHILCADDFAIANGKEPVEEHHVGGRSRDPRIVPISPNRHRRLTALGLQRPPGGGRISELMRGMADICNDLADEIDQEMLGGGNTQGG